jgi:hypothetical protein
MRQRTTWNTNEILNRTAAMTRTADPYAMNQDHIKQQPSADKYLTGDPSAFAEDITTPNNWEVEYSGGAVKRNEIGMPEDRPETFNHPEKTASVNHDLLLKKADMTVRIARRMLGSNAPEGAIEEQAASLMHLPDAEVINTYNRMANEMPPQLQKHQEQQAAKQEQSAEEQAQEQAKQAAVRGDKRAFDAAVARLVQIRMANDPQQAPAQQQQQAGQQQQAQGQPQQQAPAQQQAGQQQQAQGQPQAPAQQQAQVQQQGAGYQQAQQQAPMQQQAQGLTNPNQGISPNYQQAGQQQHMMQASDDQLIDQMLMPSGVAPAAGGPQIAEMDIQMEAPSMDIGDVSFQPGEDDMLRQLFSNDEAMAAQQAQSAQEQGQQAQGQQVQANIRTAALRTVGTRPSAGVARIGGAGAPPSRGQEVDKLTSLWQSAPDVREVFGLKTT